MADRLITAITVNEAQPMIGSARSTESRARASVDGARFVRNVTALASSQVLTWAATSIIVFALPRYLGDTNLGKLTFAWGFTSIFGVLIGFGTPVWLTRAVARDESSAAQLTFNALVARIPIIAFAFAAAAVALQLLNYPASTRAVVYIALGWTSVSQCWSIVAGALQGLERMTLIAVAGVVEKIFIVAVGVGSLAFLGAGLNDWALVVFGAGVLSFVAITAYFWRVAGLSVRLDIGAWRTLLAGGAPFLALSVTASIYGGIDVTMLSLLTEDKVVGWYGAAYRLVGVPAFIPFALTTALLPGLSRSWDSDADRAAGRVLEVAFLLTLPVAIFLLVGAEPIIKFFRYPAEFNHSIVLLRILSVHVPFVALSMVATTVVIARNIEKTWLIITVAAAVMNPLLNLAAIPYFAHHNGDGAIGAAIVTVLTEGLVCAGGFWLIGPTVFTRANLAVCLRGAAAGVPMALAMWAVVPLGLIAVIAVGCVSYAAFAFAFHAVAIDDLIQLQGLVLKRGVRA